MKRDAGDVAGALAAVEEVAIARRLLEQDRAIRSRCTTRHRVERLAGLSSAPGMRPAHSPPMEKGCTIRRNFSLALDEKAIRSAGAVTVGLGEIGHVKTTLTQSDQAGARPRSKRSLAAFRCFADGDKA